MHQLSQPTPSGPRQAPKRAPRRALATAVTEVFSPFFLVGFLLALIAVATDPTWVAPVAICLVFLVVIPQGLSIYMHRTGSTTDRFIQVRQQRTRFYVISLVSMLVGAVALNFVDTTHEVRLMVNLAIGTVVAVILINLKIKISIHAFMAALTALVAPLYLPVQPLMFGAGAAMWAATVWSRYTLKRHSGPELVLGTLGGCLVAALFVWLR